jgi:hypothetical protein
VGNLTGTLKAREKVLSRKLWEVHTQVERH